MLKELVSSQKISEKRVLEFRMDCRKCLLTLAGKLQEKSPLVCSMDCLDPGRMASNKDSSCINKLKNILKLLTETKRVDENECDDILKQYRKFINKTAEKKGRFH
ncbi:hypothetical protein ABG768_018880 [Culter alburnus]|uniref:Uncharacterized protein n=1 Tax=Culter alburnus TaxID=194366 RepID=A0AAW2AWY9_CULAL